MPSLRGACVVVTGASRGLGVHVALALADRGADLGLVARSSSPLEEVAERARSSGVRAVTIPADLADPDAPRYVVERAEAALGRVDVLVNNAGLEGLGPFTDATPEELATIVQVNLTAALLLTHAALPGMLARRSGHVANVSSLMGKSAAAYHTAYAATKFGLIGMTQALRLELGDSGVGFSVICPGLILDEGMHARMHDSGARRARLLLGTTSTGAVTKAVLKAIGKNRPEIIVNAVPVRPLLALSALSPRLGERVTHAVGVTEMYRQAAAGTRTERRDRPELN